MTGDMVSSIKATGTIDMSAAISRDHIVTSVDELERIYGEPYGPSLAKEADRITVHYRAFIEAAPFFALASGGPEGFDCSPRGDAPGFVRVHDEKTLLVPDRQGNNRIDTLRNILTEPRVALLFLIPGCGETIRVNGRAAISTDPALAQTFMVNGKARAPSSSSRSNASTSSAPRRSCARNCGMPPAMSTARACRAPAPSWPTSPTASSAARRTTAPRPSA